MGKNKFSRILAGILCGVMVSGNLSPDALVYASAFSEAGAEAPAWQEEQQAPEPETETPKEETQEENSGTLKPPAEAAESGETLRPQEGEAEPFQTAAEAPEEEPETAAAPQAEGARGGNVFGSMDDNRSKYDWNIDGEGNFFLEGSGELRYDWESHKDSIKTATIRMTDVPSARDLFRDYTNLVSVDLSGFDTSQVTDMSNMFWGCTNLASLDVSSLDTGRVTNMANMFYGCESLEKLDLGGFHTENVTDMQYMFYGCGKITSLDLSGFDAGRVKNMDSMWMVCHELIDLHTPRNMGVEAELPEGAMYTWCLDDGSAMTAVPAKQKESISLKRYETIDSWTEFAITVPAGKTRFFYSSLPRTGDYLCETGKTIWFDGWEGDADCIKQGGALVNGKSYVCSETIWMLPVCNGRGYQGLLGV